MSWQQPFKDQFSKISYFDEGPLRVYFKLFLENYGNPMRASKIAELTDLNRSYVYNILSQLTEKQLVAIHPGTPTKYVALFPSQFIEELIIEKTSDLENLQNLSEFVKEEIRPKLEDQKGIEVTQLKQTYFLNSYSSLIQYLRKVLLKCKERIYMLAPSSLISEMCKLLQSSLSRMNGSRIEIRLIHVGDEDLIIDGLNPYIVRSPLAVNNYQIIIDDYVFTFNYLMDSDILSGVGLMMIDSTIANSYSFSLAYQFRNIYFTQLGESTIDELSSEMKADAAFVQSMNVLFDRGWKILDLDTNLKSGYLGLVAPSTSLDELFRESGILYRRVRMNSIDEIIAEVYAQTKENSLNRMQDAVKFSGMKMSYTEEEEIISGFSCKIIRFTTDIHIDGRNSTRYQKPVNFMERNTNCNVVFKFGTDAVIMVWSLAEENVHNILNIFRQQLEV